MATTELKKRYIEAVGRRKESVARVRITKSTQYSYKINEKSLEEYFPVAELVSIIERPFKTVDTDKFSVSVVVRGGGIHSQAESIALGIARALSVHDTALRQPIKQAGLLKRDARIKERRKFGLKKARKSPQWSKR